VCARTRPAELSEGRKKTMLLLYLVLNKNAQPVRPLLLVLLLSI
jgi:hypothetical protein